jgi:hypothetical protein
MQKNIARLAILVLLCSCSKKDQTPSGIGIDGGTSGPSNTWLNLVTTPLPGDTTVAAIRFNSDHSVARIILTQHTTGGVVGGDTAYYSAIIPVYSGGLLSSVQVNADTLASSGTVTTAFDYTASGSLQRIRYNPGTNGYAYDSLVTGSGGMLATSYHFVQDSTSGAITEQYYENYTWDSRKDLQSLLVSTINPTNGSVSSLTASYTYDGFYNPYRTVKDLPFMLGTLDDMLPWLSANNMLTSALVGYSAANNYAYQYDPNNLPASQNLQVVLQGSLKQSTFVYFEYTH